MATKKKTILILSACASSAGVLEPTGEPVTLDAHEAGILVRLGKAEYTEETGDIAITGASDHAKMKKAELFAYIEEHLAITLPKSTTVKDAILLLEDDGELAGYATDMLSIDLEGDETRDEMIEMIRAQQG